MNVLVSAFPRMKLNYNTVMLNMVFIYWTKHAHTFLSWPGHTVYFGKRSSDTRVEWRQTVCTERTNRVQSCELCLFTSKHSPVNQDREWESVHKAGLSGGRSRVTGKRMCFCAGLKDPCDQSQQIELSCHVTPTHLKK